MQRNVFITRIGIATLVAAVTAAVPASGAQADQPNDQKPAAAQAAPAQKAAPAAQARPPAGDWGLALTEDQRAKIRALREQHRVEAKAAREGLRTAHRTLADLRRAETFDEKAFKAAAGAVAAAQADVMVQQARQRSQYRALLTPEQRARAAARRELGARVQRRAQALGRGGWNGPGSRRQGGVMGWREGWMWGQRPGQMRGWGRGQHPGWGPGPMDGPQGPWMQGPGVQGWWGPGAMRQWRLGPRGPRPPAPGEPQAPAAPAPPAPPAPPKK